MANVQDPMRPNAPAGTGTINQPEARRTEEERNRAQGIGTQMRESAQEIGQEVRDRVQDLGTQAQHLGTQVKETASEYYEQGRESLQELNQTLETQIRAKPFQALLIAGGVGLLVGLLLRRS